MIRLRRIRRMTGKGLLILSCVLALFSAKAFSGTYNFTPGCEKAWQSVIMFRFDEAEEILKNEATSDPSNLFPVYIGSYIDFLILFTGEDRALYEKIKSRRESTLDKLATGDRSSPYYRYCIADVTLKWAIVRLKFREYTAAGLELRRVNEIVKENHSLHPGFLPNQLQLGIMHALAGLVPENYKWLAGLIGFEGDLDQGFNEIGRIAGYTGPDLFPRTLKAPACLFAAMINATLRNNRETALAMVGRFDHDPDLIPFAGSPIIRYAKSTIYLKTGNSGKTAEILANRQDAPGTYRMCFLDYLYGLARLNQLDPEASVSFRAFLSGFKGVNYIKSSWQKIAWTALIKGDTNAYRQYMRMALSQGNRDVDEDKQAYYEASSGVIPNVTLLKARLLNDGGYGRRALDVLLNQSLTQYVRGKHELAEYYYRLGRIYQSLEQDDRALQYYSQAIRTGRDLPQYFAGGAALQSGIIHEQAGRYSKADSSFRLCISLDFTEYKTSLSQKAKAGVSRVKKHLR